MNLNRLRAFHWVILTGSVSAAAGRLNLTQPAVSRSLASLESELGFSLFLRGKGRLVPTEQGAQFFQEAERILFGIDDLRRVVQDIKTGRGAPLRIVSLPQLARGLLPTALMLFGRKYPEIKISLQISERREIADWVAGRQFDLGVAMLPIHVPGLTSRKFISLPPVGIVPANHSLARQNSIGVKDFINEAFISLDQTSLIRHAVDSMFFAEGISPSTRIETSSAMAVCEMVACGLGVSIVDPFTASSISKERVKILPCKTSVEFTFGFVFPSASKPSKTVTDFTDIVGSVAKRFVTPKHAAKVSL